MKNKMWSWFKRTFLPKRKLKGTWTMEEPEDMVNLYHPDIEKELLRSLKSECEKELIPYMNDFIQKETGGNNLCIPRWFLKEREMTAREFKSDMRSVATWAGHAINDLQTGSAWSPAREEIWEICRLIEIVKEKQSVKNWGR